MAQSVDKVASEIKLINEAQSSKNNGGASCYRPIAIIGIGCRFPGGVTNLDSYWRLLSQGIDATSEVPDDRWNLETLYNPSRARPGKVVTRRGGFLDQVNQFDAPFFGISPREAAYIDPQQRLLLEVSWEALENAGQIPEALSGTDIGVFMGAFTLDYKVLQFRESNRELISGHTATGSMMTMIANRLSYCFDFRGPSMAVDTACSSSLVAVHLACQSLQNGECTLALAGGVNVMLAPEYTIAESKAGMLSPDGRCKTFDKKANGYARGEGAGVIVLKLLEHAITDGDLIHGIIRGSAINQDGRTGGITVPRREAQEALIRKAYRRAALSPQDVQYVEAHGTGTPVGDPLEANAIGSVMSVDRQSDSPCWIGSVKTNFGHTEAAAGVAGLIKAVLCLQRQQIPPHLHFKQANPQIPFEELRLKVPTEIVPWPKTKGLARAGVNSFGFGGTNAHVILEEAPQSQISNLTPADKESQGQAAIYLLPFSARSPESLQGIARSYREFLKNDETANKLLDLAYSLTQRRSHHSHRLAVVARSQAELIERLDKFLAGEACSGLTVGDPQRGFELSIAQVKPTMVFVCSGMGPQWWAMGRELFEREPVFRHTLEKIDGIYKEIAGWSLLAAMLAEKENSRMTETEVAQPANFALQLGLAELWRSWGIVPDAVVGHSAGEAAAAYLAGALSLEEAVLVNYQRSHLQQRMTGKGKLLAVGMSLEEAEQTIVGYEDRISIAAINSPNSVALVGDRPTLEEIQKTLEQCQIFCKFVFGEVPYHSPYMEPLKEELLESLKNLRPRRASIPLYSSTLGREIKGVEMEASYWWKNMRQPVLFFKAVDQAITNGHTTYLELSPHPVLSGVISQCLLHRQQKGTAFFSLRREQPELETILNSLASLYIQGFAVDWLNINPKGGSFIRMPSYAWNHELYWQESSRSLEYRLGGRVHPLLGRHQPDPYPCWQNELDLCQLRYLDDHRIQGAIVYPGAAYAEMGLTAIKEAFGNQTSILSLENVEFSKALFLPEGENRKLQSILDPRSGVFKIYSKSSSGEDNWTLHCWGKAKIQERCFLPVALDELRDHCRNAVSKEKCYRQFRTLGLEYGETFQGIDQLWQGEQEALARVKIPEEIQSQLSDYTIHPAILDVCFQVLAAALPFSKNPDEVAEVYLPTGVELGWFTGQVYPKMWIHACINEKNNTLLKGDIRLLDDEGNILLEIQGCHATSLRDDRINHTATIAPGYYEMKWQERERIVSEGENDGSISNRSVAESVGTWILFTDEEGVGSALATRLESRGDRVVTIRPGKTYQISSDGSKYQVNPAKVESFQQLLNSVTEGNSIPCKGLIHLWSLDLLETDRLDTDYLQLAEKLGCNSVLHLIQSLSEQAWRKAPKLWLVTKNAQQVEEQPAPLNVVQSPLWGMGRCLGHQEHRDIWGGIVDLDSGDVEVASSQLYEEILHTDGEDQVAFRSGQRYVARLINSGDLTLPLAPTFRPDSAYLITGGFGGLGLSVARWMVNNGARRIVLMSRNDLPPRTEWFQVKPGSKLATRIAAVQQLEALGASIHTIAADVTDEEAVIRALSAYEAEGWPAIRGVIHSAGTALPQILLQMSSEQFNSVLRPKMMGAWILHQYFCDRPLDCFVLFSSIASLVVSTGQGNYAAGNAFMDALATYRQARGLPGVSINWGPWAEVGMATQLDLLEFFENRGNYTISPSQGLSILGHLIGQNRPQVAVVAANWSMLAERNYVMGIAPPMLAELVVGEQKAGGGTTIESTFSGIIEKLVATEAGERQQILEEHLKELTARVLRLDHSRFTAEQPLNTLGLDSMMAIELKNYVENSLGVGLAVVDLLSGPSVAELAEKLMPEINLDEVSDEELSALLEGMSEEEVATLLESI